MRTRVAICTHLAIEHYRGGEKWAVQLANHLDADPSIDVSIRSLPYTPTGTERVAASDVLDPGVRYSKSWLHDLGGVDVAYVFYHPGAKFSFPGADSYVAGIHSWVYVSPYYREQYYGPVPTAVKLLYRTVGSYDLGRYDGVHTVTPAFDSPHENTAVIPNFVDRAVYRPDRAPLDSTFTVLVTAAKIEEKGWDLVERVAATLPEEIAVVSTGDASTPAIQGLGFLSDDELADQYARSHVVLHPARVDTDSMVINEAIASGTPVVTSPLLTHVRKNEAILHGATAFEMAGLIEGLAEEYRSDRDAYRRRCDRARELSRDRATSTVVPRLKAFLTGTSTPSTPSGTERVAEPRGTIGQ